MRYALYSCSDNCAWALRRRTRPKSTTPGLRRATARRQSETAKTIGATDPLSIAVNGSPAIVFA